MAQNSVFSYIDAAKIKGCSKGFAGDRIVYIFIHLYTRHWYVIFPFY